MTILNRLRALENWRYGADAKELMLEAAAEIERLRSDSIERAGWEVEGFIDRLTRRDDTNSERLVLEAISHLRAFSRDCDALRDNNRELRAEIERFKAALDLEPVLTNEQHKELTTGYGAILPEVGVFELGWRTALGKARRALEEK